MSPVSLLEVTHVQWVTPHLARITFGGADLAYDEPDQQLKLYFPKPGHAVRLPRWDGDFMKWYQAFGEIPEPERPWMRSYTIRAHHPEDDMIDVDFVLHPDAGPATRWAASAQPGDTIGRFGPSPMFARPVPLSTSVGEADWLLLAGDHTALPAISSIIEWLPRGLRAVAYVEVGSPAEEQRIDTRGDVTVHWLHGRDLLVDAVRAAELPPGSPFAWIAGEAGAVRALRRHLVGERGLDKRSIEFTGHWRLSLSQDDAPTAEDLADAGVTR